MPVPRARRDIHPRRTWVDVPIALVRLGRNVIANGLQHSGGFQHMQIPPHIEVTSVIDPQESIVHV
jgi:hypothetical protein